MREIGSEFWDVPCAEQRNTLFPDSVQWFLSGRSALQAIIEESKKKGCHTVAMPSWCCDSMVKPFFHAGIEVQFYPVYWESSLVQEPRFNADALFLMDYFGYTGQCPDTNDFEGIVIRDVTHSLLSSAYSDADYYFGSLRKWCGVWTGGYAWAKEECHLSEPQTRDSAYIALRKTAMQQKAAYISGAGYQEKGYFCKT